MKLNLLFGLFMVMFSNISFASLEEECWTNVKNLNQLYATLNVMHNQAVLFINEEQEKFVYEDNIYEDLYKDMFFPNNFEEELKTICLNRYPDLKRSYEEYQSKMKQYKRDKVCVKNLHDFFILHANSRAFTKELGRFLHSQKSLKSFDALLYKEHRDKVLSISKSMKSKVENRLKICPGKLLNDHIFEHLADFKQYLSNQKEGLIAFETNLYMKRLISDDFDFIQSSTR